MQLHINTYGSYLHVKDQMFEVKTTKEGIPEKHHIAALKVKSIWLNQGTALSSDAVALAIRHNIDIVFLEKNGHPLGRVWHTKLGSTTLIRKKQLEASLNQKGWKYTKQWIGRKLENQIGLIQNIKKHRVQHHDFLNDKIERTQAILEKLNRAESETTDAIAETLRGWEGTVGRLYFETLSYVLPTQYQFNGRSFRPAKDPFNTLLNYAYGILYSKTEKVLILAGIDPYIGFLHRDDYNYKSMVYDFIEPYRVYADTVVFRLCAAKKVNKTHVRVSEHGCQITKEGKVLLVEAFNKFIEEDTIRYKGRNQNRSNAMQMDAHQFANELIVKTPKT